MRAAEWTGLQQAAASLLGRGVPIIVAVGTAPALAALKLTYSVPKARWRHGYYSAEAKAARREARESLSVLRTLLALGN
jgi:hypothetical protein